MKKNLPLLLLLALSIYTAAQDPAGEKLKQELINHPQQDTFRVNRLLEMVYYSRDENYYNEAGTISRKIGYATGEGYTLAYLGFAKIRKGYREVGDSLFHRADSIAKKTGNIDLLATIQVYQAYANLYGDTKASVTPLLAAEKTTERAGNKKLLSICQYFIAIEYANAKSNLPKGLEYYLKSIHTAEEVNHLRYICAGYIAVGRLYKRMDDQANASLYFQKAREANKQLKSPGVESQLLLIEGNDFEKAGRYAAAIDAFKRSLESAKGSSDSVFIVTVQADLADAYTSMDSLSLAFKYGFSSVSYAKRVGDYLLLSEVVVSLSKTYLKNKMPDSAIYYAKLGYDTSKKIGAVEVMRDNTEALANAYAYKKDFANGYAYHVLYTNYSDSVMNTEVRNKSAVAQYNADLEKKQAQITALNQEKKIQKNFLYSVLAVLLLIIITAFILLKSNRQKQKAKTKIEKAYTELKNTQQQLIQSEKMASLGELTAGIAHEIQNPLNFVNNFSEVSNELIDEMNDEIEKGDMEEAKAIANDIKQNLEKILHHGKRADGIVKGMLQHSRSSSATKEPTDINKLADEYLRLAYHGLRAKDKSFNATLKTDFDESIENINVIPQDIGRAVLNLITNAFYAVTEKKKYASLHSSGQPYEPTVSVSTKKTDDKVEIKVADNGNGIPQRVLDKIFQPFFTTKPTGQGTGLGLSYDIVKAHGGELKVETKEGEGAEFIIII